MNNEIIRWLFENEISEFQIVEMDKNRYQLQVDKKHLKQVLLFLSHSIQLDVVSVETDETRLFVEYKPAKCYLITVDGGVKVHE